MFLCLLSSAKLSLHIVSGRQWLQCHAGCLIAQMVGTSFEWSSMDSYKNKSTVQNKEFITKKPCTMQLFSSARGDKTKKHFPSFSSSKNFSIPAEQFCRFSHAPFVIPYTVSYLLYHLLSPIPYTISYPLYHLLYPIPYTISYPLYHLLSPNPITSPISYPPYHLLSPIPYPIIYTISYHLYHLPSPIPYPYTISYPLSL